MRKQSLRQQLYKNLLHPRKSCMFRFLRIGHNILYAFFVTLISAVFFSPAVVQATIKAGHAFSYVFLPIGLIYYYIVLSFLFFTYISILSLVCFLFAKGIKRRVNGQQAWSLTANSATWPTLLFSISNLVFPLPPTAIVLYILFTVIMTLSITLGIPKPKSRHMPSVQAKS